MLHIVLQILYVIEMMYNMTALLEQYMESGNFNDEM